VWAANLYEVALTVTEAVAEASNGGVLYYFCHIHSKMSGKIQIRLANDDKYTREGSTEKELYPLQVYPPTISAFDDLCGTVGISEYATGGSLGCEEVYLGGTIDSTFERCLNALNCMMNRNMRVLGHDVHTSAISTFMQQMIPHHHNAINMAKLVLKQVAAASVGCALEGCGADNPDYVAGEAGGVTDDGELANILWGIINQQTYQIHQFYGYLGGDATYQLAKHGKDENGKDKNLGAESVGPHCENTVGAASLKIEGAAFAPGKGLEVAGCVPTELTYCSTINVHAGPTGLYMFEGIEGVSPTINVTIGETLYFDQRHVSNWFHPLGFAYEPDGAHGSTWGGDELPEVEGLGELLYKINGAPTTCADAGDTGLDCYEPEFFYPRAVWAANLYEVALTVTEAVAEASNGGVLYYFCHIHSKMSGKIQIRNADGTKYTNAKAEKVLYSPPTIDPVDSVCGTTSVAPYAGNGTSDCAEQFLCGTLDTTFEKCMNAVDCLMKKEMLAETSLDPVSDEDKIVAFMQQMLPHHENAVNMAKIILKQVPSADIQCAIEGCETGAAPATGAAGEAGEAGGVTVDGELSNILWEIVNSQTYQMHQFRGYLNGKEDVDSPTGTKLLEPVDAQDTIGTVVLTLVASGSVSDYSDTSRLQGKVAIAAGVPKPAVTISVAAASVRITATIAVPASTTTDAVEASLASTLGNAADASAALGITVEEDPTWLTESSGDNTDDPNDDKLSTEVLIPIIVCSALGFFIVLGVGGYLFRMKMQQSKSKSDSPKLTKEPSGQVSGQV